MSDTVLSTRPTALTAADDWWFVRAYPGRLESMDDATRVLVPWLRENAAAAGAQIWFFMRYLDMSGQHLRLRMRCAPGVADSLYARTPELLSLVRGIDGPGSGPRLVAGSAMGEPGSPRIRTGLYAPELLKYGGLRGTAIAEQLFTDASHWYLDNAVVDLDPRGSRALLAVTYLRHAVAVAAPGGEAEFWSGHRRQWSRHLRMAAPGQDELRRVLRETSAAVAGAGDLDHRLVRSVQAHAGRVARALTLATADPDRSAARRNQLLLNYLHMDMNRWGFLPAEECALGMVAASGR